MIAFLSNMATFPLLGTWKNANDHGELKMCSKLRGALYTEITTNADDAEPMPCQNARYYHKPLGENFRTPSPPCHTREASTSNPST